MGSRTTTAASHSLTFILKYRVIVAHITVRAVSVSRTLRGSNQSRISEDPVSTTRINDNLRMLPRLTMKGNQRVRAGRLSVPKSPTIMEVTEDSSPNDGTKNTVSASKFGDHPRIQESEY